MARYDVDEQLSFVQSQLDKARESREKSAKEQEKFSKKLLVTDTILKGATSYLNYRADKLDQANAPARSKYQSYIKNANDTLTYWDTVTKNGGKDYLQKQIFNSYLEAAKTERPFEEVQNIQSWLNEQAGLKANELYATLETKAQEAKDVPTLEEFIAGYDNFSKQAAPRSLFGAAVKGFKNIIGIETPDTLAFKKDKAKGKVFSAPMFKEIEEFAEVAETYDKLGYDTPGLIEKMNKQYKEGFGKRVTGTETKNISFPSAPGVNENKLVNVISYADGSKSTEVLLENKSYDTSLLLTATEELGILSQIKPEQQDQVISILKKGGGNTSLKTNIAEAWQWAISNNALKPNLQNLKDANIFIDNVYQDVIKGKFTSEGIPMFRYDIESKQYQVKPDYLPAAKREGWDAETFRQTQLNQLGLNYTIQQDLQTGGDETSKITSVKSQITDPTKLKQFNELVENPSSNVSKFTMSVVGDKTGIVDLGDGKPLDLKMFFPNILEGKGIIKYNTETSEYYVEGAEGELAPKYRVIPVAGSSRSKNVPTPTEGKEILNKYNLSDSDIQKFIKLKPKVGPLTQNAPGREDPIDFITTEMLRNAGYNTRTNIEKSFSKRKFINDLYKDLEKINFNSSPSI
jgi:hypothetical protein